MATKTCPFCAEEIQEEADVCIHCGRIVSGTVSKPPRGRWGRGWHPGKIILMWFLDLVFLFGLYPTTGRGVRSEDQFLAVIVWLVLSIPVFVITWRWLSSQETK